MRFAMGSSIRGLAGMAPAVRLSDDHDIVVLHPLLQFPRVRSRRGSFLLFLEIWPFIKGSVERSLLS